LELRLVHTPHGKTFNMKPSDPSKANQKPYAIFEAMKGKKIYDMNEVCQMIQKLTDKVAGKNKGIVDNPIVMTMYGEDCPDLTLIDLPGITRVPVHGTDMTDDVERITKSMAARYVKDKRTIILCVLAAN